MISLYRETTRDVGKFSYIFFADLIHHQSLLLAVLKGTVRQTRDDTGAACQAGKLNHENTADHGPLKQLYCNYDWQSRLP